MLIKQEQINSLKQKQEELAAVTEAFNEGAQELAALLPGFAKMEAELQELGSLLDSTMPTIQY